MTTFKKCLLGTGALWVKLMTLSPALLMCRFKFLQVPAALLLIQLLANAPGKTQRMTQAWGPVHPHGRSRWCSRPSPHLHGHVRSESMGGRSLFFFLSITWLFKSIIYFLKEILLKGSILGLRAGRHEKRKRSTWLLGARGASAQTGLSKSSQHCFPSALLPSQLPPAPSCSLGSVTEIAGGSVTQIWNVLGHSGLIRESQLGASCLGPDPGPYCACHLQVHVLGQPVPRPPCASISLFMSGALWLVQLLWTSEKGHVAQQASLDRLLCDSPGGGVFLVVGLFWLLIHMC